MAEKLLLDVYICIMLRLKPHNWIGFLCLLFASISVYGQEPTTQISNLNVSNITCNSALIQWSNGDGDRRIVIVREALPTNQNPVDGKNYFSSATYGNGEHLGNNNYVVFLGPISLINVTGLKNNTTYYVSAFEYNNNAGTPDYLTTSPATVSFTTYGITLDYSIKSLDSCWYNNKYQITNNSSTNIPSPGYQWNFGDGTTSTTNSPSKSYAVGGLYNIYLTIFPNYGCKDTLFKKILVIPQPVLDIGIQGNDTAQCLSGNSFSIKNNTTFASITGLGLVRTWAFGDNTFDNTFQPKKTYDTARKYSIKNYLEMTYNNVKTGCKDTGQIRIEVYPNPSGNLIVSDTINCIGKNTITFENTTPNTVTYDWDFGDGATASGFKVTHDYATPGTYKVIHTASSIHNCQSKDTIKIIARNRLSSYFAPINAQICQSKIPIVLNPDDVNGIFMGANVVGNKYVPQNLGPDTIIHILPDAFCPDTFERYIEVIAAPKPDLGKDQNLCNSPSLTLKETIPGTYEWSDGSTSPTLDVTLTGTYWIEVSDGTCTGRDSIYVYFGIPPVLPVVNDTFICKNSFLKYNFSNFDTKYQWNDGSRDSFKTITSGGVYTVTATNPCGSTSATFNINQLLDDCNVIIPSAFSPNGDGRNDVFKPVLLSEDIIITKFIIFNSYGMILFQSNGRDITWDGKYMGKLVPGNQNYQYLLYYILPIKENNQKGQLQGSVFLIN